MTLRVTLLEWELLRLPSNVVGGKLTVSVMHPTCYAQRIPPFYAFQAKLILPQFKYSFTSQIENIFPNIAEEGVEVR